MRFDLKKRRLVAKSETKEQKEKVLEHTNGYVECSKCEGTGIERDDQYSWDCQFCKGRGSILARSKK